jgi:hypothetical protein
MTLDEFLLELPNKTFIADWVVTPDPRVPSIVTVHFDDMDYSGKKFCMKKIDRRNLCYIDVSDAYGHQTIRIWWWKDVTDTLVTIPQPMSEAFIK